MGGRLASTHMRASALSRNDPGLLVMSDPPWHAFGVDDVESFSIVAVLNPVLSVGHFIYSSWSGSFLLSAEVRAPPGQDLRVIRTPPACRHAGFQLHPSDLRRPLTARPCPFAA